MAKTPALSRLILFLIAQLIVLTALCQAPSKRDTVIIDKPVIIHKQVFVLDSTPTVIPKIFTQINGGLSFNNSSLIALNNTNTVGKVSSEIGKSLEATIGLSLNKFSIQSGIGLSSFNTQFNYTSYSSTIDTVITENKKVIDEYYRYTSATDSVLIQVIEITIDTNYTDRTIVTTDNFKQKNKFLTIPILFSYTLSHKKIGIDISTGSIIKILIDNNKQSFTDVYHLSQEKLNISYFLATNIRYKINNRIETGISFRGILPINNMVSKNNSFELINNSTRTGLLMRYNF